MVFDSKGDLYFDDFYHQVIFKADRYGTVKVFAGTLYSTKNADGAPGVGSLSFAGMPSLAFDKADNLYVSGQDGVRKIDTTGVISSPQMAWGNPIVEVLALATEPCMGIPPAPSSRCRCLKWSDAQTWLAHPSAAPANPAH